MKNQNKIDPNIQISDDKCVLSKDLQNDISINVEHKTLQIGNSNGDFQEISNEKSLSKKNEKNNGLNPGVKDFFSEEKSEIKFNFNIPFENNIFQTLKENFAEKSHNEINPNMNKTYNESQLRTQIDNTNFNPTMISNPIFQERDMNNKNLMDNSFNQRVDKEGINDKLRNQNINEMLQMLSLFGENTNLSGFDHNLLNSLLQCTSSTINTKEIKNNESFIQNLINQINPSNQIGAQKEEDIKDDKKTETIIFEKECENKIKEKSEKNKEMNEIKEKALILNDIKNKKKDELDNRVNFRNIGPQQKSMSINPQMDKKILNMSDKVNISNNNQQKIDMQIFPQTLNVNEDLNNNINYLNFLINTGNLSNLKQSKINNASTLDNSNSAFPLINPFNGLLDSNHMNIQDFHLFNQSLVNPGNVQESDIKSGPINLENSNTNKGAVNFHIHFHFNLNFICSKNTQNNTSSQMANTADVRKNSNEQSLSEKSNINKEEYQNIEKENSSKTNNFDNGFVNDLERICNKYNNKIIESNDQDNNKTFAANLANFNSVFNKNVVCPENKINDLIYYLDLFNSQEMNNNLLNLLKQNLDVNKITEDYKNLLFNDACNNTTNPITNIDSKQSFLKNNISFNNSINNLIQGSNMPYNMDNMNMSNLISSLLGANCQPSIINNNATNNNNNINDPINILQNPTSMQQLQSLLSNPEFLKSDNMGILNSLYNFSNLNNMSNMNEKNLRNNSFNTESPCDIRNINSFGNTDKDLINELNNFNRTSNNNNSLFNLKNSSQNNYNPNKNNVFLSNKIKRKNSNHSDSPDNKNYKSFRSEGRYCESNYGSHNNFDDINDVDEQYYRNRGYGNMSQEGKNNSVYSRNNDDLYDFIKTKKFHIKKFNKNEQAINANNMSNSQVSNFPSMAGNIPNVNMSNLSLPENKSNKENRKFKADSIHKKIKVNVLKYLKATICEFIPNKKVNNLSQEIITNVNISFNKELLEKQLYKIYEDDYLENDGLDCLENIKTAMSENREFFELMNMTLKDFIIYKYWRSDFHKKKLSKIFQQESYEYYVNYEYLDKEFINYFLSNKGNKRKILRNKKGTSQDGKSEYSVSHSINA